MLVGTLREADLDRRTARLHTPSGETVGVTYPPELESAVHEAMRALSNFEGVVTYDPKTSLAKRVEVRRIFVPAMLFGEDFWAPLPPLGHLASEQGVGVPTIGEPLVSLSEEERSEILDALAELDA